MSEIRANLVEAAVRAEVEHVEAALIEASERVLARIRASFADHQDDEA